MSALPAARRLEFSRDGRLLFAACAVRLFAFGFLSVVLGPYLAALGLSSPLVGALFTTALAASAVVTVALTAIADRLGRRRVLVVGAALMAIGGALFAVAASVPLLALAAMLGTISPSGKEVGPFLAIEQAILPQTASDERRTSVFAAYNLVGSLAGALGALAVGLPAAIGLPTLAGYRMLVWGYAAAALVLMGLFARLSPGVEVAVVSPQPARWLGIHRSRGVIVRLAGLFALDAFAGGFVVQGLVAYWFHLRYGVGTAALGAIFFGTNLVSTFSFLAAAPIARRFGLLNTMVFTHLPSNVLLLLVPLMPGLGLAVTVLLARHVLSQLDVPTRQSYTMAVVEPDERSAAAGLTAVTRNGAAALAPALAGLTLAVPAVGLPFLVAGGLKIIYDLSILRAFRHVRPAEERARTTAVLSGLKP